MFSRLKSAVARARTRLVSIGALMLVVAVFAGCSESTTSSQIRPSKVNLSIGASISSRAATQVLLIAAYSADSIDEGQIEDGGEYLGAGLLAYQLVDLVGDLSASVQLSVDIAQCLRFAASQGRAPDTCPYVYVEAILLTGQNSINPNDPSGLSGLNIENVLDLDVVGPFSVSTGATVTAPRDIVLHEVSYIEITPFSLQLRTGQTGTVTATPLDLSGKPISGRTISWMSDNPRIATVDSKGTVTAVSPGSTTITASTGGRETFISVFVQ